MMAGCQVGRSPSMLAGRKCTSELLPNYMHLYLTIYTVSKNVYSILGITLTNLDIVS